MIAGLGSIGRRHLRNLLSLGRRNVVLYRSGKSTLADDELAALPTVHDLAEGLARRPQAVVVSNPTSLHLPVALQAAKAGCHLLIEKPLSHSLEGLDALTQAVRANRLSVLVGFQFLFHPGLIQIRQWLKDGAIGAVVSAQAHWGEYLPQWHPWEDYRASYSARADLGGGVTLTLCHPFNYLHWMLGEVESVAASARSDVLETDTEDVCLASLRFAGGAVASVYLDYLQRPSAHWLTLIGREGTLAWDNADGAARLYRAGAQSWTTQAVPQGFERNTMFLDEMKHFLQCIDTGEAPRCGLDDGIAALKIALAVKEAAQHRREVRV